MANKKFLPTGSIQIVNGPSKFDFVLSNYDFKKIEITCTENGRQFKLNAQINFGMPEDGSGERWIGMIGLGDPKDKEKKERRAYYYDTRTRTGSISAMNKKWELVTEK